MTRNLYFDESGFTGHNYLDPLQPIFSIASNNLEPSFAEQILKESFPKYKGDEFKFSVLWKLRKRQFLDLATRLADHGDLIKFWVVDKHFAVMVKMVDFLIEPGVTAAGYNFLANGFGRKFANYLYFGLKFFATSGSLKIITDAYQTFSRAPSKEALRILTSRIKSVYEIQNYQLKELLGQMLDGCYNFEKYFDFGSFKSTNDLQFAVMLGAVVDWRKMFTEDFRIIHDATSNFMRQKETWDRITGVNVFKRKHPLGDGSEVEFPLRVIETLAVDSRQNYSVQLADVLAGYASKHFDLTRPEDEREILDEIVNTGLGYTNFNSILPGHEFPNFPPERLTGPDAVDKMSDIMGRI